MVNLSKTNKLHLKQSQI